MGINKNADQHIDYTLHFTSSTAVVKRQPMDRWSDEYDGDRLAAIIAWQNGEGNYLDVWTIVRAAMNVDRGGGDG